MSIERVKAYLDQYGLADRIREFEASSATVELAARAASPRASASSWRSAPSWLSPPGT